MFFKKIFSFGGSENSEKIISTPAYSAYNSKYDNRDVTIFKYETSAGFLKASNVHKTKHTNILRVFKIDDKKQTITTERVALFSECFSAGNIIYNKYAIYVIANVLDFLHSKCKLSHNSVEINSIFINQNLNLFLGGFHMAEERATSFQKDTADFKKLSALFGLKPSDISCICRKEHYNSNFFDTIEAFLIEYPTSKTYEKKLALGRIRDQQNNLEFMFRQRISQVLIFDLKKIKNEENVITFKEDVVDVILSLITKEDVPKTPQTVENIALDDLFQILDPSVRLYLYQKPEMKNLKKFNNITFDSLLLGIKCKDKELESGTMTYIYAIHEILTPVQMSKLVNTFIFLRNTDHIEKISSILTKDSFMKLANRRGECVYKELRKNICRLMESYLQSEYSRIFGLKFLDLFFKFFSFDELCGKIIPMLFDLIRNKEHQEDAFMIIDKIICYLKDSKKDILAENWSFSKITSLFYSKKSHHSSKGTHESPPKITKKVVSNTSEVTESMRDFNVIVMPTETNSTEESWSDGW